MYVYYWPKQYIYILRNIFRFKKYFKKYFNHFDFLRNISIILNKDSNIFSKHRISFPIKVASICFVS